MTVRVAVVAVVTLTVTASGCWKSTKIGVEKARTGPPALMLEKTQLISKALEGTLLGPT